MKIFLTNIEWKNRNIPRNFELDLNYKAVKMDYSKINEMIYKQMDSLFNDKCLGFKAEINI